MGSNARAVTPQGTCKQSNAKLRQPPIGNKLHGFVLYAEVVFQRFLRFTGNLGGGFERGRKPCGPQALARSAAIIAPVTVRAAKHCQLNKHDAAGTQKKQQLTCHLQSSSPSELNGIPVMVVVDAKGTRFQDTVQTLAGLVRGQL